MTAINKDFRVKHGIVAGGNVTAQAFIGDGSQLSGVSTFTGSYNDLTNKPVLFSGNYLDLTNRPTIPSLTGYATESFVTSQGYITTTDRVTANGKSAYIDSIGQFILPQITQAGVTAGYLTSAGNFAINANGNIWNLGSDGTLTSPYNVKITTTGIQFPSGTSFNGSYNDLTDKPSIPSLSGYATETYVNTKVANLVASAPAALDTLNELATALGNDANFATTISTQLGLKANTSSLATVATTGSYTNLINKPTTLSAFTNDSGFITTSSLTWSNISGKPTFATVATTGSYNDLLNKPSLTALTSVNTIQLDTTYNGATPTGQISWNSGDGTLDVGLLGGSVVLQVGQESVQRIYNNTGATLTEGTVVYITGAQGQRLTVNKAQANTESTSSKSFGMVTENIANAAEGYITTDGMVRNLNTSAYPEGSALWLSPTTAGGVTTTKPQAPNHIVLVGFCVRQHATAGSIYVKVQNGFELDELHDVQIISKANDDILKYDATTGVWKNAQLSSTQVTTALGYTPYNSTNPNGYISGITSSNVTTALGYTPATPAQVQAANDNAVAMAIALG